MTTTEIPYDVTSATRIGFLADSHSRVPDGSDLPQAAMNAFADVGLIVHCGDVGNRALLDRLGGIAPVMATRNMGNPMDGDVAPARVIEAGGLRIGVVFDISTPGVEVKVEEGALVFPAGVSLEEVLRSKFGQRVDVVAFGGTHLDMIEEHEGVLFFNPGSPTLHVRRKELEGGGTVAVLEIEDGKASARIVRT